MTIDVTFDSGLKLADGSLEMIKDILTNLNVGKILVAAKPKM